MAQLSIIVTTYNIEKYVVQSLESVAAQTLRDIEVVVVDDGSTDATPALIAEFCAGDERFVPVLLAENSPGGVATAANAGLDRATAPWVGFVDGDDYVEPTMFEQLLTAATSTGSDLAMCDYQEAVDGTGELRDPADAHRWAELPDAAYDLDVRTRQTLLRFIAVPWRKLYKRDLLEDNEIRFPVSDGFFEDNPFHWFVVLSAQRVAMVPQVLCYHRVGRAGQTMATADERLFHIFHHHDTIHAWLAGRRLLDAYQVSLLIWVISQMEWISRRTPPELQRRLFDLLAPIFAGYAPEVVNQALREGNKGVTAQRLSTALVKRELGSFTRALSGSTASENPVVAGVHHLRASGVRHTALLTGRYVRNRLRDSRTLRRMRLVDPRAGRATSADVLFAMTVLQRRLRSLEDQVRLLESRVDPRDSDVDEQRGDGAARADRLQDAVRGQ